MGKASNNKARIELGTASSPERTCSIGESVPHSVIIPPKHPCSSPESLSISPSLRNLNFASWSMSSLDAPSCFNRLKRLKGHNKREQLNRISFLPIQV